MYPVAGLRAALRILFAMLVMGCVAQRTSAQPAISPVHAELRYPSNSHGEQGSIPVRKTSGQIAYALSLEPQTDAARHVIGLELVLHNAHAEKDGGDNLLYRSPLWHGYQSFIFAASDFVHGPEKSTYGRVRQFHLDRLRIDVRLEVSAATVAPVISAPSGPKCFEFGTFDLKVDLQPSEGIRGQD